MNNKEQLTLLEKYYNIMFANKDSLTKEDVEILRQVQKEVSNNNFAKMVSKVDDGIDEGMEFSEISKQFVAGESNCTQIIATTFGVEYDKIETQTLQTGEIVFKYFDYDLMEEVVIKMNSQNTTFEEAMAKIQKEYSRFDNSKERKGTEILKYLRNNTELVLQFISVGDIENYIEYINTLPSDIQKKIAFMCKYSEEYDIKSINMTDGVFLNSDDNLFEIKKENEELVVLDKDGNIVEKNKFMNNKKEYIKTIGEYPNSNALISYNAIFVVMAISSIILSIIAIIINN